MLKIETMFAFFLFFFIFGCVPDDMEKEKTSAQVQDDQQKEPSDSQDDSSTESVDLKTDTEDTGSVEIDEDKGAEEVDPCEGQNCSEKGECVVKDGQPLCECKPGYEADGLECVEVAKVPVVKDCRACGRCPSENNCPSGAISRGAGGRIVIDPEKCSGCGDCVSGSGKPAACPFGRIVW